MLPVKIYWNRISSLLHWKMVERNSSVGIRSLSQIIYEGSWKSREVEGRGGEWRPGRRVKISRMSGSKKERRTDSKYYQTLDTADTAIMLFVLPSLVPESFAPVAVAIAIACRSCWQVSLPLWPRHLDVYYVYTTRGERWKPAIVVPTIYYMCYTIMQLPR